MRGKLAFIVGAATGYVLGSRAGRERYEQIRRVSKKLWNTGPVQKGVQNVRDRVDERAGDVKLVVRKLGSQILSKMAEQTAGTQAKPKSAETEDISDSNPQAADAAPKDSTS